MTLEVVLILIGSGLIVGFINTLAGSATIVSVSVLIFLGLPPTLANGTNRVAVFFQNIVAVRTFNKQHQLDIRKGLWLGIPTIIGSIVGAFIASEIDEKVLARSIGIIMIFLLVFMLIKPLGFFKGNEKKSSQRISVLQIGLFFILGVYGGYIHLGIGIFLLATLIANVGYDLIRANALKNFIVFLYNPFALIIFMANGLVNYEYGLIHAIGNVVGAYVASKYAINWGHAFLRVLLIIVIAGAALVYLDIIQINHYRL